MAKEKTTPSGPGFGMLRALLAPRTGSVANSKFQEI